jgi:hypothetical protein
MSVTIGSVTCNYVKGAMPTPKMRAEVWQVPGINGYGLALLGVGDSAFSLNAIFYGTLADCGTWAANIQALQSAIVAVTNDLGQSYSQVFLVKVSTPDVQPRRHPGTTITHRAEIEIKAILV